MDWRIGMELDIYQKEAIFTKNRNSLILAPPGSGKTTVVINRCVYLIKNLRVNPLNIVVITFTKSAAMNMKKRFMDICKDESNPFFGTFHGLFYKLLLREVKDIKILGEQEGYRIIKKVLSTYMDSISDEKIRGVLNDISRYKSKALNDGENYTVSSDVFDKCFDEYENYKTQKGLWDFDDLQINFLRELERNESLKNYLNNRFKYILVDEFQDCDHIQIEILRLLNLKNSLFCVGDEDQCIYSFRGSKPECMVSFCDYFKNGKKIFLKKNYRSRKNIVQVSESLIKNNKLRNPKEIHWIKEEVGELNHINVMDESEQCNRIKNKIYELRDKGYKFNEMAIIYRTNVESRSLIDGFLKSKIPFKFLDREYHFFNHFICKDILAYLRLSTDSTDKENFLRIINKPFRYVSKVNIEKIKNYIIKENLFLSIDDICDMPDFQAKLIKELWKDIEKLKRLSSKEAVEFVLDKINYREYIYEYSEKYKIDKKEYEEIIDEFIEAASEFLNIFDFLEHVNNVDKEIELNQKNNEPSVIFSTIHGVKGMEFKNVFIINVVEENIPHKDGELEEERRVFYVGMTRAIDNLYLISPMRIRGKFREKSKFIEESSIKNSTKEKGNFKNGVKVIHSVYGEGVVLEDNEEYITILFNDNREKKFLKKLLIENNLIKFL